jgi:acetylornithine deacetylase/succinyl-diaminopimelate desuccinylase-like protein
MKRAVLLFFLLLLPLVSQAQEPEVLRLLKDLIRIDTSNPPGNETRAAEFIREILAREGISSEIIESEPGRGNLIARLKGDGSKPAMILLGHLDVVPADPKEWEIFPFDAEIRDGMIWGRGALDMKSLVAMEVATFLRLKRENTPLAGDLILVFCADEEAGGAKGAEFLVKHHWDKIEAKYLFNEGSVGIRKMGMNLYPIQVAEKGVVWMKVTARGRSGHGSMPIEDNAVSKLAEATTKLASHQFPVERTEVIAAFLERLSTHLPFPKNLAGYFFHPLVGPVIQKIARRALSQDRAIAAVLSHTISPTMLQAGYKVNVIPAEATAMIDARILPGETPERFRDKVKEIIGDQFEVELITSSLPNESDFRTDYFRIVEEAVKKQDPKGITAPIMSAGGTDARFFRGKGVISYGIIPLLLQPEELEGLHGRNERIPMDGLEKGVQIVYDIVKEMQGKE